MLLEMPRRVQDRPLPEVEIVDMRAELENGNRTVLSTALRKALKDCASRGEQAMLLMNRRGYHSFVSCRSCGKVIRCPRCDLSLTYHAEGRLQCHYCGHLEPPPVLTAGGCICVRRPEGQRRTYQNYACPSH
jgi:primosomal protein N' (replication factor Y)